MHVAVTGSTGLIGETLVASLESDGHVVHRVVRDRAAATGTSIYWSVARGEIDAAAFSGLDAVVHLAGEPIGARRWTAEQKARIRESRVAGTQLLATALAALDDAPPVLLSGSAVGFYGDRGEEILDETSGPGTDYMAGMCRDWEAAAAPAEAAGLRVVHPRTGVVMARKGPLIEKVEVPFKLGVGGRVGSGRQWVPWMALGDHVRAMRFLLDRDDIHGPVNLVAPQPVRNTALTRALGKAMHRPTVMPVPVFALRLLYGEVAVALGTVSQRVVPAVLRDAGFEWQEPDLLEVLQTVFA